MPTPRSASPLDGPLGSSGAAPDAPWEVRPRDTAPAEPDAAGRPEQAGAESGSDPEPLPRPVSDPEPVDAATTVAPVPAVRTGGPAQTDEDTDEPGPAEVSPAQPATGTEPADETEPTAEPTAGDEPGTEPADGTEPTAEPTAGSDSGTEAAGESGTAGQPAGRRRRIRVPFAHAARRFPPPRQAAVATGRWVRSWSRRPSGRLTLPGLLLLALVAVTGVGGAVVIPNIAHRPKPAAIDASASATAPGILEPTLPGNIGFPPLPTGTATPVPTGAATNARPAVVLAAWAQQTGARVNVPTLAIQAYGYAELALTRSMPGCHLTWTTLAAIGLVESNHGRHGDSNISPTGEALPHIIGPRLDGTNGNQKITDTDGGALDGDTVYDRAVGPMQFIPSTWRSDGVDADNDGIKSPHDINDAALAAGNYLCKNNRDLATGRDWWNAILSYNDVQPYAHSVFDAADRYGKASNT